MELTLRNYNTEKTIDFNKGKITSIQTEKSESMLKELRGKYNAININNNDIYFVSNKVKEELDLFKITKDDTLFNEAFKILELDNEFLEREISSLSYTEKIYLNILVNTHNKTNIIIFTDVFLFLDYNNQKKIKKLIEYLKKEDYIIIITSSDVDVLYKLSDYSIIWTKNFFTYDITDNIYTDVEKLLKNKIKVPTLSLITYKAITEKKVKLFYQKDVRDVIKDIYKHV